MTRIELQTGQRTEMIAVTDRIQQAVDKSRVETGICYIYVPHTTAAITINESADPMVAHDALHVFERVIPMQDPGYRHMEGNSSAHAKSMLVGTSETVLVEAGQLVLGTWQGVFFCEFDGPRHRHFFVKLTER